MWKATQKRQGWWFLSSVAPAFLPVCLIRPRPKGAGRHEPVLWANLPSVGPPIKKHRQECRCHENQRQHRALIRVLFCLPPALTRTPRRCRRWWWTARRTRRSCTRTSPTSRQRPHDGSPSVRLALWNGCDNALTSPGSSREGWLGRQRDPTRPSGWCSRARPVAGRPPRTTARGSDPSPLSIAPLARTSSRPTG